MKCPNCGGNANLELTLRCPFCGSSFTREEVDRIKRGVTKVVEYTVGAAEEIRLCNNANAHYALGEFRLAYDDYLELQRQFPKNYMGWFGEAKCATRNFTDIQINSGIMANVEHLIDNALKTANANEQQLINSQWLPYLHKYRAAEAEKQMQKQREEDERQLERQRKEEEIRQEEQRKKEQQEAQKAAERLRQQQKDLKRKTASTYGVIIEILFVVFMFVFQYMKFVDDSLAGFLIVNVIMLVFVLVVTLIHKSGNVISGVYVPSYINALFAASIAIFAIFNIEGAIAGFLALIFFGVIEFAVAFLGFFIVTAIIHRR